MKRTLKQIKIWSPIINRTPITSKQILNEIINREYAGIKRIKHFNEFLQDAECHLSLFQRYRNQKQLGYGELRKLVREFNMAPQKIQSYLKDGRRPRLYFLIEKGFSKTQAAKRKKAILAPINNLESLKAVQSVLETYYPFEEMLAVWGRVKYSFLLNQVRKYFHILSHLNEGGSYSQIAREMKMRESQVWNWLNSDIKPDLLNLASKIPDTELHPGKLLLPLEMRNGYPYSPLRFIQVTVKPTTWDHILTVLESIQKVESHYTDNQRVLFNKIVKNEAFAYVLGLLTSDAAKNGKGTSLRFDLRLSKSYGWSKDVGQYACFCLGQIGISAYELPSNAKKSYFHWISEKSPLITWMLRSCLGIARKEVTTYNRIHVDWLFKAPYNIQLKFLQGLNDGDGWASVCNQAIGNTSGVNKPIILKLLQKFEIRSFEAGQNVQITNSESVNKAVQLPFFMMASGRQKSAEKIAEMIEGRSSERTGEIPIEIYSRMLELRKNGYSHGRIAESIFDETGHSYHRDKIRRILLNSPSRANRG